MAFAGFLCESKASLCCLGLWVALYRGASGAGWGWGVGALWLQVGPAVSGCFVGEPGQKSPWQDRAERWATRMVAATLSEAGPLI